MRASKNINQLVMFMMSPSAELSFFFSFFALPLFANFKSAVDMTNQQQATTHNNENDDKRKKMRLDRVLHGNVETWNESKSYANCKHGQKLDGVIFPQFFRNFCRFCSIFAKLHNLHVFAFSTPFMSYESVVERKKIPVFFLCTLVVI